ncbi:MAG TPA: tRNA (adenosine(37)-N6)-threonylcarbamoyltransferase complex dimerization subunit type 1 TsaB [Flavobacteriales bacterium]|nr:tRNA (adenosine(37)-N6)-threonylcarbamoyltransferase complex dimerization subunit type 1 TsaB [Flavobacteriales bacterium]
MPLILCIETATKLCSVALGRDGVLLAERGLESERHIHAEKVNVFIEEVLREGGIAMRDLNAVAVGIGPGSYTGLRIGLSAAKGLCYALRIPIIGIGTLETLVNSSGIDRGTLFPMIDARRMEVFTQRFVDGEVGEEHPLVLDEAWAEKVGACTVFGDGADKAEDFWARHPEIAHLRDIRPHARAMIPLAERRLLVGRTNDLAYLVPRYGKEANVTQPRKVQRP